MGSVDFRVGGRIFATLAAVKQGYGNLMLDPEQQAMFLGEDAATNPEVGLFNTWMKKTHPNQAVDLFGMFSWAAAAQFVQALKAAGQNPTRQDVVIAGWKPGEGRR